MPAIGKAGGLVAITQLVEFACHVGIDRALPENDLQAGFALVFGLREFHGRIEIRPVGAARAQLQRARRRLALGQTFQQLLEAVGIGTGDHVHQRQTFDFEEVLVTEHFEITSVPCDQAHFGIHYADTLCDVFQGR